MFLFIPLLLANLFCIGQNTIGIPDIINFSKDQYHAGTQNRGIAQDSNGVMYFANYKGLLSFDGTYWKNYALPNKTVVRSIAIGNDSRIYAGGQEDFGYFSPKQNGSLVYTSLKTLLSEKNNSFSGIWNIVPFGNDIFFLSREKIFQLSNQIITVFPSVSGWQFLGESDHHLFAQDALNGLLEFGKDGLWRPFLTNHSLPEGFKVTCIFPYGQDSSFIATVNTGFYILSKNIITPFRFRGLNPFTNERILTAIPVNEDWLAIGTNLDGVYIVNKKGEVIQNLSRKEGLQNNNILKLFIDKSRNLWLGLDNGIDFIAINNALKHIYPEKLNEGLGYTSIIHKKNLYVGTSNGLYTIPLADKEDISFLNGNFQSVPNTKGSTWGLAEVNDKLLLAHNEGAYEVLGETLRPIEKHINYWTFLPFSSVIPSTLVLAGNDIGINFLKYEKDRFVPSGNLTGFNSSAQFMALDNNNTLWVAHPYRGVYRIEWNGGSPASVKLFTEKNGLPSNLKNRLFKIKNHIVVTTTGGIYEFNARTGTFEFSNYFKGFFNEKYIRHLKEDANGNIWFIEDDNLGVIDFSEAQPETIYFPELIGKMVADFEHIYPYNKFNVFVGADKGFYHINYAEYKKNLHPLGIKISAVRIMGKTDSLLFDGYFGEVGENQRQPEAGVFKVSPKWNSLHFEYSSPAYAAQSSITYSYLLKGFDKNWSAWSNKTEKDYNNLSPGSYTFQVKSKGNRGDESHVSFYAFVILPPWYMTTWAFCIYLLVFIAINYLFYTWLRKLFLKQQKKYKEEQKKMQYYHQMELEKSEKEIVKLKNEKLEAEIEHKNNELAATAMHLVQKGELLGKFREELLRSMKKELKGELSLDEFKKMLRILNEENRVDKDWEQFAIHFDGAQGDFLKLLKQMYPALSPNDQKLCAYLRMNLSSKEIAQLENISVRGVEISRYRLRKKLNIPKETNLFEFLLTIHTSVKARLATNGVSHGGEV